MVRKYKQKNPSKKGAKKPSEVYRAIALQYCKGRSQTKTTQVVSRWARYRGFGTVTRQTVSKHFSEFGDKLFHSAYLARYGPRGELVCDECRNRYLEQYREYLYASADYFKEERARWDDQQWWVDLRALHGKYYQHVVYDELLDVSRKSNGLPERTFYIYWSRVYWLRKLKGEFPAASVRELLGMLVQKCFQELPLQKGIECHNTDYPIDSYRYFTNGVLVTRISFVQVDDATEKTPCMAEVVGKKTSLRIDNTFIFRVMWNYSTDWTETTEDVFSKMLDHSTEGILDR